MSLVHPTAIVHDSAVLGAGVRIGPYAVVGAGVELGAGCVLEAHAVIDGPCVLGEECHVHSFAALGGSAQRRAGSDATPEGGLIIGPRSVFREHSTVHRGTHGATEVGADCLIMAGAHVAHDVRLGQAVVMANLVQLAGHVVVEDHVTFGGMAGVAQHVHVGESAFVAAGAMCERDIPPFVIAQGDRARVRAVNRVGLRRRGAPVESRMRIARAFRALYLRSADAETLDAEGDPWVERFLAFHRR